MKSEIGMLIAATIMTAGPQFVSRVTGQELPSSNAESALQDHLLLPPRADRIGVLASRLHWGMPGADVERLMGAPAEVQAYAGPSGNVRVLEYPAEPIATKVSICDGRVCAVRLDVAGSNQTAIGLAFAVTTFAASLLALYKLWHVLQHLPDVSLASALTGSPGA